MTAVRTLAHAYGVCPDDDNLGKWPAVIWSDNVGDDLQLHVFQQQEASIVGFKATFSEAQLCDAFRSIDPNDSALSARYALVAIEHPAGALQEKGRTRCVFDSTDATVSAATSELT